MAVEERLVLPSRGIIYPEMNNVEYVTVTPYKSKAFRDHILSGASEASIGKLIDTCLVNCPLKASEFHASDWTALIFKVRAMSLGNMLPMKATCPYCNESRDIEWDLSAIPVKYFTPDVYPFEVELPESHDRVTVMVTTPKMVENARIQAKERARKMGWDVNALTSAYTYVCNLFRAGLDLVGMSDWYDNLPVRDAVYLTHVNKSLGEFGPDIERQIECPSCSQTYSVMLRVDESFFLPNVGEFGGIKTTTGTLEGGIPSSSDAV